MKVNRDHIVFLFLFLFAAAAAFFTYWQTTRVVPLLDYSFQTEIAYRISLGQIPYRDFILPVTPGVYTLLALAMRLFGSSALVQVLYTSALGYIIVIVTFLIISQIITDKKICLLALLPLIVSAHGIYPYVSYDTHAVFFSLIALLCIFTSLRKPSPIFSYITGFTIALPVLFKQNIGGAFLLVTLAALLVLALFRKRDHSMRLWIVTVFGVFTVVGIFFGFLLVQGAFNDFIYQTVFFAAQSKHLSVELLNVLREFIDKQTIIMAVPFVLMGFVGYFFRKYRTVQTILLSGCAISVFVIPLLIYPPEGNFLSFALFNSQYYMVFFRFWLVFAALALCIFLWDVGHMLRRRPSFVSFMPAIMVAICIGAWLSLNYEGSMYGLYAVLPILVILFIKKLLAFDGRAKWEYPLAIFSIGLTCILFIYNVQAERFKYYISWTGDFMGSSQSHLAGLKTRGPWLPELDELLAFINTTIPRNQSFFACPGEDPLYSATEHIPVTRYDMLYGGTNYDNLTVVADVVKKHNIPWIIIKNHQQLTDYFWCGDFVNELGSQYNVYTQLTGYTVYRAVTFPRE